MFVPLRVLTHRTPLYTYVYSQVYILQKSYHGHVGISTGAVQSHTCLCPCGCLHLEPLCIQIFTSVSITYIVSWMVLYMNSRCANSYRCLCPCDCSQLEPLCIHRYTRKYTNFILQIHLCMTSCCANSHMSVPLRVLTLRTSLHTYICHKYTYIPSQVRLYSDPCCAISHLYVPLRVLTLRTSLYTNIHNY